MAGYGAGIGARRSRLWLLLLLAFAPFAEAALPRCPQAGNAPRVNRLVLARDIQQREPVGEITSLRQVPDTLYLFTEMHYASGIPLVHDWFVDQQLVSRTKLKVGGQRWRTWSRVSGWRLAGTQLRVEVTNGRRCLLTTLVMDIGDPKPVAAPASTPEPDVEPEPEESAPTAASEIDDQEPLSPLDDAIRRAKLRGDIPAARELLSQAMASLPNNKDSERQRLRDELYFYLPLLELDAQLYLRDRDTAEATLQRLIRYLDDHPQRSSLRRELAEYAGRVARLRAETR